MIIAKAVEQAVYKTNSSKTDGSYRTKVRSLFLNLKDPKNPNLRKRVVSKEISAERVATMSSEEMASSEMKQELKKIENENMKNAVTPKGEKATTDQFQCGKCKQRKVSYSQAQTRSADEPMTTVSSFPYPLLFLSHECLDFYIKLLIQIVLKLIYMNIY